MANPLRPAPSTESGNVLAQDDNAEPDHTLSFSSAGDIVELVIFTIDDIFLQTLREAVAGSRRLWHVPSPDQISDLLLAGQVGILVLDAQALPDSSSVFVAKIKLQFPELVIVVAGHRDAEGTLANLISNGIIYRFIHKPVSPGRAKLFVDAAVRKYGERLRVLRPPPPARFSNDRRLAAGAVGVLLLLVAVTWALRRAPPASSDNDRISSPVIESPLLTRANAALAANRLSAPNGDDALGLYRQILARNPSDAAAQAGLAEVRERLSARAENALLEERLEEAALAIDTARKAGVDVSRIALLTSQLAKSRERLKAAAAGRPKGDVPTAAASTAADTDDEDLSRTLNLAAERIKAERLIEPDRDSAAFYIRRALQLAPDANATVAAKQTLAIALLRAAHTAIDRRDFDHAGHLLDGADGIASSANVENVRAMLRTARQQADAAARDRLLKAAQERLQQDRLIEPADDNAKYYLMTLRTLDPGNPGLAAAFQDLGTRLIAKARRAVNLQQLEAARGWLDEAAAVGYSSQDSDAVRLEIETAAQRRRFLDDIIDAGQLTLVKSVQPRYPQKATQTATDGWVELDFTVTASGDVTDVAVHAASRPGVFDQAALSAVSQWHYQPVLKDGKPTAQRARLRIRFTLKDRS